MTIEDFEKEIRDIFISKGWGKEHDESGICMCSWFIININSIHRRKEIKIYRQLTNDYIVNIDGIYYEDVFEKALFKLKEQK